MYSSALAGDASSRRYARLRDGGRSSAILVSYPAEIREQLEQDLAVRSWLAARGLRVPAVLERDLASGWAVLEDFGTADAEAALAAAAPASRTPLAARLLEPLVALARIAPAALPTWNTPLDGGRLRWELAGFELWFVRHRRRRRPGRHTARWLDGLADGIASHPARVCHRDYHLNNLYLLADGEVGLIDYQDVLVGPDTYDLASLLGERGMPELLDNAAREGLATSWARRSGASPGWQDRLRQVRWQRGLKVLGTFARLDAAGRSDYVRWLDGLARRLAEDLVVSDAPSELSGLLLDL